VVVPAHLLVWRDRLYQLISNMRPNVRVFRNRRVAKGWLQERAGTFVPMPTAETVAVEVEAEARVPVTQE